MKTLLRTFNSPYSGIRNQVFDILPGSVENLEYRTYDTETKTTLEALSVTENEAVISFGFLGINKEDIKITFNEKTKKLKASTVKPNIYGQHFNYYRTLTGKGFEGKTCDFSQVKTEYQDGILKIFIPLKKEEQTGEIEIKL